MKGINAILELKNQEATTEDLLEWMANSVNERDRHRKYLKQVEKGMRTIVEAKERHQKELEQAKTELGQAIHFSKTLVLPQEILDKAKSYGSRARFETVAKQLGNGEDFGRTMVGTQAGVSYSPQMSKTMMQLKKEGILHSVDEWLSGVDRVGGTVRFTFIQADTGINMTVSVSRVKAGKTVSNNVKQVHITEDQLRELRRKEDGSIVGLPQGDHKPIVQFECARFMAMLHKMTVT